ncbi:MAG: BspA family leucine-rich repeat surface protein [Bacteroidota bacterium]
MKKFVLVAITTLFLLACAKDDSSEGPSNQVPTLKSWQFSVVDDLTETETIGTVVGTDEDDDKLTYALVKNPDGLFTISPNGELRLAQGKTLDFATAQQHNITVSVTDGQHTETANITITVTSANNAPTIAPQTFTVPENIAHPETIGEIVAEDPDGDDISFAILEQDEDNLFEVTWRGMLRLVEGKSLDFATDSKHVITMAVGDNENSTSTQITIILTEVDETNLSPIVDDQTFEGISEDIVDDYHIGTVEAQDPEGDALTFSILENDQGLFAINETTGVLTLAEGQSLDFESAQEHTIIIRVSDGNTFADAQIVVTLNDVEEAPIMEDQSFEVLETAKEIGKVTASDPQNDTLTFSLLDDDEGRFTITSSGDINLAPGKFLNFEQSQEHQITVQVTDTQDNSTQALVTITILDVDEAPLLTSPMEYDVLENIPDDEVIGTIIAKDPEGEPVDLTLKDDAEGLFEMADDGTLSLAPNKSLDYETLPNLYEIMVTADDGENARDFIITIRELDVSDQAPKLDEPFVFDVLESVDDAFIIGTITAIDPDGDPLTYAITVNDDNLFKIDNNGQLSLAVGRELDYQNAEQHIITVAVSDDIVDPMETQVTINVIEVVEDDPTAFITTWKTDFYGESIEIGVKPEFNYDFRVDWGDGTIEELAFIGESSFSHAYETPETYTVTIQNNFPAIEINDESFSSRGKLRTIEQWGNIQWKSMERAFRQCHNLVHKAEDAPDLSQVTNLQSMFSSIKAVEGKLDNWDVSTIEDMSYLFYNTPVINSEISGWNTENVKQMQNMFNGATSFNQDIGGWNTQNVTEMSAMFANAISFNGNIGGWNTQNVTRMISMFFNATAFNQDIGNWNTQNVTQMGSMFQQAITFNQDISGWNTQNLGSTHKMFQNAASFNQDLGNWAMQSFYDGESRFADSGMSPQNYSKTLIGWAQQYSLAKLMNFENQYEMEYCNTELVEEARQVLMGKWWSFSGDTEIDCN